MDFVYVLKFVRVVLKEIWQRKVLALILFGSISFLVLLVGKVWPSKFVTQVTLYADNQNILGPLLKDQAAQSKLQDHSKVVTEMLHSPSLLREVAKSSLGEEGYNSPTKLAEHIAILRERIMIEGLPSGYIKVSYTDRDAGSAYFTLNSIVDIFVKSSAEEQRSESKQAFTFIDNQVKQYKEQLLLAEERLKEFSASNFDGRDGDVHASIRKIRDQIENLKIYIDEDQITIASLEKQLEDESEYSSKKVKKDIYRDRLNELESRLSTLLLSYTSDYPDVVSLRYQIEDTKKIILEAGEASDGGAQSDENELIQNPLYQEIRSRLSQTKTDIKTKEKRLTVLNELLENEFERRKRIAERAAEEAELTRDYTVTKKIYEDMLERKEKARLSMTLNIEGQGVTYRVQEPAVMPLKPIGLSFIHFVIVGPIIGLLTVIGIAVLYVLVDPRVRFASQIYTFGVPVLATVSHVNPMHYQAKMRVEYIVYFLIFSALMTFYVVLAHLIKWGTI